MEGIAEILKYEKRPLVFVNTTLQAENYAYIDDLVSEIGEMGVDGMNINLLWTRRRKGFPTTTGSFLSSR